MNSIPSYLYAFPNAHPAPPVNTNHQTLPIEQLTWDNFERLCCRLAQREGEIESCSMYGIRGQEQQGIDIFSLETGSTKYTVYQCKHENDFGPQKIESAVNRFKRGTWLTRSQRFVICTKESLRTTQRLEKIELLRKDLQTFGIELAMWDSDNLSSKLKAHPDLVDDFFGRQWVKLFNGPEAAEKLKSRLEGKDFTRIRSRFAKFYALVFQQYDPGIPHHCATAAESPSLLERYIVPDIVEKMGSTQSRSESDTEQPIEYPSTAERDTKLKKHILSSKDFALVRRPIDSWLASHSRLALLGEPGSGKSSLLRFLALDILSEDSRVPDFHKRWGGHLPVWIPFAFWTRQIKNSHNSPSISTVFKRWLQSYDDDQEFESLFDRALEDDRIIILVDGLDEWANEKTSVIALQQLNVFIQKHQLSCIVTCRTYSYSRHELSLSAWPTAELATFSPKQQKNFCANWYSQFLSYEPSGSQQESYEVEKKANLLASSFLSEAQRVSALHDFLENPLLLGLLLVQKFMKLSLPSRKEKVIEALVNLLIAEHPKAREAAAQITDDSEIGNDEYHGLLSYIAYEGMLKYPEGGFPKDNLLEIIEDYLRNEDIGFGWERTKSRNFSHKIIKDASEKLGVLVEKSPQLVGFYHRSIQEFLASKHILRLSTDRQKDIMLLHCYDLTWRQVLLFFLAQVNRDSDVKELVTFIESEILTKPKFRDSGLVLIGNTIFMNTNCPVTLTKRLGPLILEELYTNPDSETKLSLLDSALNGLCTSRSKDIVLPEINFWYPCRSFWREPLIEAIATWKCSEDILKIVWRGLFDEEVFNQRATAHALAKLGKDNSKVFSRLEGLFLNDLRPSVRAVALEAIANSWNEKKEFAKLVKTAQSDSSPDIRLVGTMGHLLHNKPTRNELNEIIDLIKDSSGIDYNWRPLGIHLLEKYWKHDPYLKAKCLATIQGGYGPDRELERDAAWTLLIGGFSKDEDVVHLVAKTFSEKHPFLMISREPWHLLAKYFPNNDIIGPVFEAWATSHEHNEMELALATGVSPSNKIKKLLIERLNSWVPFWAADALHKFWPNDPVVIAAVMDFAGKSDTNAANIGHLLHWIISDKHKCRTRLLELIKSKDISRIDFVMRGIFDLDGEQIHSDVVDAYFSISREETFFGARDGIQYLLRYRPNDDRVKELAIAELNDAEGMHAVVAHGYKNSIELESKILSLLFPLSTELRFNVVRRLTSPDIDPIIRNNVLGKYRLEHDSNIKTAACIGFHKFLVEDEIPKAEKHLIEELWARGPNHAQIRQAAFCGLVEIGKVKTLLTSTDPHSTTKKDLFSIPPEMSIRPNSAIKEYLVEKWTILQGELGEKFVPMVAGNRDSLGALWSDLSDFADQSSSVRDQIIEHLEETQEVGSPAMFNFWRRHRPKSKKLLEFCLLTVDGLGQPSNWRSSEMHYRAAEIIGTDFSEYGDALKRVTDMIDESSFTNERAILTLAIGWPKHPKVNEAFKLYLNKKIRVDFITYVHLNSLFSDYENFAKLPETIIRRSSNRLDRFGHWLLSPLEKRLKDDPKACSLFFQRIRDLDSEPDLQISLMHIANRFGLDTSELADWALARISKLKGAPDKQILNLVTRKRAWALDVFQSIVPPQWNQTN